jgi:L-fuculose-phosphate aldolase
MEHKALREAICETARQLTAAGLNLGSAGNIGARIEAGLLVTPTGLPAAKLAPQDIVTLGFDGVASPGQLRPTSEWRFHRDILAVRPEVQAVIHTHAPYATALACCRLEIPAFHYMVAIAGGPTIPCAPYAGFGTQALSEQLVTALEGRRACLMANHGMVVVGGDLAEAARLAAEVEHLARLYWLSLQAGGPVLLSNAEMQEVEERFVDYGRQPARRTG